MAFVAYVHFCMHKPDRGCHAGDTCRQPLSGLCIAASGEAVSRGLLYPDGLAEKYVG